MLTCGDRRVKDESNGRVHDDLGRTVHQERRPDGETTRIIPGRQRPVLAPLAIGGGFVAVHLPPAWRGSSGAQKTVTLGAWPTLDVRKAAEEARRLAGEVAASRDPRADIRETKRRERAVVVATLDDYEQWTVARRLRKVTDDDVGAAAGPRPSPTARP